MKIDDLRTLSIALQKKFNKETSISIDFSTWYKTPRYNIYIKEVFNEYYDSHKKWLAKIKELLSDTYVHPLNEGDPDA